jgi:hypothetical protein
LVQGLTRIAIGLGLLGYLGLGALRSAASPGQAHQSIVQRPGAAIPHSFTIRPSSVTLAENETQRFGVTNAEGKAVAVRWNVSGLDCSGLACGTIDDDGTYQAPHSLSEPLDVVLEGVLVSDPKHSLQTRIHLAPAGLAGISTNTSVATGTKEPTGAAVSPGSEPSRDLVSGAQEGTDGSSRQLLEVTYGDGQLSINAENETLAAVLQLVAEKTGAVIEVPPGTGTERIFEHAGPGQANEVLTQLLTGSHFNFVIVNSPQHPSEPEQVLLSLVRADPESPAPGSTSNALTAVPQVTPETGDAAARQVSSRRPPSTQQLSPEEVEMMMQERTRELREQAQQQREQPPEQ